MLTLKNITIATKKYHLSNIGFIQFIHQVYFSILNCRVTWVLGSLVALHTVPNKNLFQQYCPRWFSTRWSPRTEHQHLPHVLPGNCWKEWGAAKSRIHTNCSSPSPQFNSPFFDMIKFSFELEKTHHSSLLQEIHLVQSPHCIVILFDTIYGSFCLLHVDFSR